jgi:hypothetical protein
VQAQKKAQQIGGTIKDTSINQIRTPDPVNRLIGGFDIRQGTFEDTVTEGYDITTETGEVIGKTKSLTDAENRVNRATELRKQRQLQLLDAKQKIQENIAKSEQAMADLEALGKKDSEDFKKIQNSMAAQERNLAKVEQNLIEFGKKVAFKSRYKQQKRTGFTLFEGNKPVGTYNSRQEALEASVVSQPTDRLEAMLEAFPTLSASAKPGMDRADIKKLQQVAASELASRKGEIPSGVGITVEGDITAAEERLALQGIFSPRIKERVNELDKKLRAALDKLGLKDVRLNIVGAIKGELGDADGVYAARLIKIALDAENPMRVLRHEGIHALKELGAFTPDQWRVLENKAKSEWMAKYNIADPKRYGSLSPEIQLEEAIAEAFADFSQTKPPAGLIGNVFSRIKSFFAALDNGFKGLGFQTADDVFGRVERGELLPSMGERAAEVEGLQAQRVTAETSEPVQDRTGAKLPTKPVSTRPVTESVPQLPPLPQAKPDEPSMPIQRGSVSAVPMSLLTTPEALQRTGDVLSVLDKSDPNESLRALNLAAERGGLAEWEARAIAFGRAEGAPGPERYSLREPAKVIYEVAPDPNNVELTERWNALPIEQKTEISKRVGARIVESALPILGARGRVADQVGSYLEFTNPSFALVLEDGDPIEMSKFLGFALSQDSMMVVSGDSAPGLEQTGGIVVDIGEVPFDQIDAIYQQLREIEVNGQKPVGGQTTVDGKMIVLNYSGLPSSDLANLINQKLGGQFDVATGDFFTAFPEKGEYDYASPSDDPTGSERFIRQRSRDLRAEASRLLSDEINAVPKFSLRTPSPAVNIFNKSAEKPDLGKKPTVQKVGEYFDKLVQDEFGRKLDYSNSEDFARALEIAKAEVEYQLQQENSGLDWYDEDIKRAFQETIKFIPELRQAQKRHLFSIMSGIMSPQTNARDNWFIAGQAFKHYTDTGEIPGLNPETGGLWMGGTTSKNKKTQLEFLNRMVEDMGEKKAVEWLLSDHPVKEINGFRQKYGNIKSGIGGKMDDIVPGLYAFGPKVGPFVSNINGIHDVTVDLWMTRTFNRYFGTMIGPDGKISDAPTEPQRRAIKRFITEVAQNANIKPYQAQSVLWFFEQKLFRELGTPAPSFGFSDGARKLSGRYPATGDRGGEAGVRGDAKPNEKFSLRTTNTPEFRGWFGQSKIVDAEGRPRVMYHGTARDITEFKPKQAGAIFVTEDPRFAEDFSYMSEMWMIDHADQFLSEQEIKKAVAAGVAKMAQGVPKQDQIRMLTQILQFPINSVVRDPDATEIRNEIAKRLPSKPNILPVYVRAENPFDFDNQNHLEAIRSMPGVPVHYQRIRRGEWSAIEEPDVQEAVQKAGFDSFYITEGGRKNLAVYDPNQLKSVTGNIGTYGQREPTINEAKQFGLTVEEAKAAQKRGDIRYSLRNTNTPEFKQWFRKSPIVDAVGKPQMMFHGTSLDIEEFIPGQTGAIYVSPDPEFAGTFAKYSQEREIRKLGENLDQDPKAKRRILDPIIDEAMANGDLTNRDLPYHRDLAQVGLIKDLDQYSKEYWMNWFLEKPMRDAAHSTGVGPALREALANMLTTGRNVMPLYVNPQKPFDYENNTHVNKVAKLVFEYDPDTYESANPKVQKYQRDTLIDGLKAGDWRVLEEPIVQEAIKELGFDAFYVKEQDVKNLGLYTPNQLKSAIGNTGAFSPETGKVRYSLRQTNTPAFKQWFKDSKVVDKKGDPLVVYHGTDKTFDAFNLRKRGSRVGFQDDGFYFSDSPGTATTYATMDVYSGALGKKKDAYLEPTDFFKRFLSRLGLVESAPQVVPAFLSIKNPYKTTGARMPGRRELIKQGYDGIQYTQYDGTTHWVAFEPTQIKSSIGNIGTFDPENPDIRYSLRVPTTPEFKRWSRNAPFVSPDNSLSYDFKTGKPFFAGAYHGTNTESNFVAFDIEKGGLQTGAESAQLGVFSTSDPAIAENYASNLGMGRYLKLAMQGSPELKNDPTAVRLDKKIFSLEKEYSSLLEGAENEARKKIEKELTKPGATFEFGDSVLLAGTPFTKEMFVNSTLKSLDFDGIFEFAGSDYKTRATKINDDLESTRKELSRFIIDNEAAKIPQRILPLFIRMKNPMVYDAEGQTPADFPISDKIAEAKRKGHDGVVFKNIADPSPVAVHYVTFKPDSDIKSGVGNIGTYGQREPTEAEAAQFGMTKEEAKESQKKGDIRYSLRQQAGQTLGQSYLDTVQRTTTPRVEKGFKDRISEAMSATPFAKFRQMFINKYERIEYFSKQLAKQFGDAVLLADQSAIAAALMSDRAAGVAAESFKSGIPVYAKGYTYVDNMGGKVKGLMEILMPLAQKQDPFVYQMYQDYAARRRGVRLDSEGKITPFTRQELSEIPNIEKAFPEFKQVFEDYQRYNEGLVRYMRDTGVIDAKAAQEWMRYGDYVPFYRQLEGESTVGPSIFSAISGVKAPKKLKGGDAPLGEFLETVVRNSRAAIEAGMRNVAANRVVNNFQRLNSPSTGGRLVEKTSEQNKNRPDVVTVRENGKDAYYKVADPLLVQSLQALNIPQIPGLDILAKPAEFLREMVTRDPAFIGASVLRESLSAWITTGQKLTPVASGVNQFVKILANASPTVQALRRAGIGSGYEFKGDVQATAGEFGRQLKEKAGEMTTAQKAVMPLRAMWDSLDKASTAADLSTRAAVFERVMQETGNEAEAIYQAMEVINFSRKGSSPIIQIFAAIIPFLNARIQGLDLLYRAGFGELASATKVAQQKAFMLRSLALLGTTAMYYALVQDEEEWQRADQETRDNYWIIGNMKFPIPFELGVMFKVLPERIMAYTMGEDTGEQVRASIARQVLGTLSFNPIPQAVLPLIEASSNYSFFLQRDIVGMGKKDLAPEFQTSEGTSQIAIQLGQTLGISPMKIDYVIRGYTGAMGTYAISTMDSIIRSEDDATKATWRLDQIPVLKRFMISDLGAGTVNEYYDLREKLDEVVRTSNQLERTGNIEALQDYLKDNGQVLGMKDYIRSLDKDMKSLRESRMAINMSRMEPDQKREALDSLRRAEISLTERIGLLRSNLGV